MAAGKVNFAVQAERLPDEVAEAMKQLSIERQDRRTMQAAAASQRHDTPLASPKEKRPPLLLHRVPRDAETPRLSARVTEFNIREHLRADAKKESDKYERYVMYTVRVERGDGSSAVIYRRYNDFELLHEQLPSSVKNSASFPARRFWARLSGSRFSNKSLEGRRQALSTYIGVICDVASDLPIVNLFLSDAWLKIRKPYQTGGQASSGRYIVARNRRLMAMAAGGQSQSQNGSGSGAGRQLQQKGGTMAVAPARNSSATVNNNNNNSSDSKASPPGAAGSGQRPGGRGANVSCSKDHNDVAYMRMVDSLGSSAERFVTAASLQARRPTDEQTRTARPSKVFGTMVDARIVSLRAEAAADVSGALGDIRGRHIGRGTPARTAFSRLPHAPIPPT